MIFTKRITILCTLLCLLLLPAYSQRVNFEQLKKDVLEAQNNREKANAMMVLGGSFSPRQSDQIFSYADSILLLADNTDEVFYKNASTYLKAVGYYKKGDLPTAKRYFRTSYAYFSQQETDTHLKCLNFIGIIHLRTNQPDSAITIYNQLLAESDDPQIQFRAYGNMGSAYRRLGDYEKAINSFEKCVSLDSTNEFAILNSYLNVASMYAEMELFNKGIDLLKQIDVSVISPQPIVAAYFNDLGELYFQSEQYDSAIAYLTKGFELALSLKQNQQTLNNRLLLSEIYISDGELALAQSVLSAVKKDLHYYPTPAVLIDFNLKNANYFLKNKEYDSAIHYAKKALAVTQTRAIQYQAKNSYEIVAQAFELQGLIDSSAYYYKKHAESVDSLDKSEKEKFAQDAKARYMLAQTEKDLDQSQAESTSLKSGQKILIVLLLLLAIAAIYFFGRFRKSKTETATQRSENSALSQEVEKNKNELIKLKSRALLPINDIISIKADGHYLEFSLMSKATPEVDRNQIKSILENLPSKFVQIHRSYIVNVDHIKVKYADKVELNDGKELPVSRTFKDALAKAMDLIR